MLSMGIDGAVRAYRFVKFHFFACCLWVVVMLIWPFSRAAPSGLRLPCLSHVQQGIVGCVGDVLLPEPSMECDLDVCPVNAHV